MATRLSLGMDVWYVVGWQVSRFWFRVNLTAAQVNENGQAINQYLRDTRR